MLYVLNATINNTISQLPPDVRAMSAKEFFARCNNDEKFMAEFNLKFSIFDEFNLLGQNQPKTTNEHLESEQIEHDDHQLEESKQV